MKKLKDGLESSFDPNVVANQMTNARKMVRQCRKVDYDEVQRSPVITPIEAPYSSVSRNSATLFYSHSKHYQPLLLTFLTLHDPNYKTYKPRKYSYCNTY
ncbi:hypothetical protein L1049_010155 [Liquidambar formosana]|uniref:Uncharacterized protein n=1 Tax=Liquidambar formosana TaxID=63359 RepID=A0AAP0N715_LIQFO